MGTTLVVDRSKDWNIYRPETNSWRYDRDIIIDTFDLSLESNIDAAYGYLRSLWFRQAPAHIYLLGQDSVVDIRIETAFKVIFRVKNRSN